EERWKSVARWPPPSRTWSLYPDGSGKLSASPPRSAETDQYPADFTAGTGTATRWRGPPGGTRPPPPPQPRPRGRPRPPFHVGAPRRSRRSDGPPHGALARERVEHGCRGLRLSGRCRRERPRLVRHRRRAAGLAPEARRLGARRGLSHPAAKLHPRRRTTAHP